MARRGKSTVIIALLMGVSISLLGKAFSGVVIARLPFTPLSFMKPVTHYGLPGEDFTECGQTFIFVLSNMSLGAYVKRVLMLEGPRSVTSMNPPTPQWGR